MVRYELVKTVVGMSGMPSHTSFNVEQETLSPLGMSQVRCQVSGKVCYNH